MSKSITIRHGWSADDYEKQANAQGYTFGTDANVLQSIGNTISFLHIRRIITDSEYDKILRRFTKYLGEQLKEKEDEDE